MAQEYPALTMHTIPLEIAGKRYTVSPYHGTLGIEYFAIVRASEDADRTYIVTREGMIFYTRNDYPRGVAVSDVLTRTDLVACLARVGYVVPFYAENADAIYPRSATFWVQHFNHAENGARVVNPPPAPSEAGG